MLPLLLKQGNNLLAWFVCLQVLEIFRNYKLFHFADFINDFTIQTLGHFRLNSKFQLV